MISPLMQLIALKPQGSTRSHLFKILHDIKKDDEAVELLKDALFFDATLPQIYCSLGELHQGRRNHDLTEHYLRQAIELDPKYARAYGGLGAILYSRLINQRVKRRNAYKEAKRMLLESIELNPYSVWPRMHLGNLLAHIGHVELAEEQFQAALEIWPDCVAALWLYADLLSTTGKDRAKARRLLTQAIEIDPNEGIIHFYLGKHLVRLHHNSQAKQAFQKAVELGYERAQKDLDEL